MVKQLIYDSRMIVKKETIISACYDIQSSHKKHDGMIVVFLKSIIVLTNLNRKCRFIRYFSLERKVTKSSRLTRTGYSSAFARCRVPTRFAQTGMLRALATVSSLDARPLRPSEGKRSFPLISAGISLFNSLFTINY